MSERVLSFYYQGGQLEVTEEDLRAEDLRAERERQRQEEQCVACDNGPQEVGKVCRSCWLSGVDDDGTPSDPS